MLVNDDVLFQDVTEGWAWPLQPDSEGKGFLVAWSIDNWNVDENPRQDGRVLLQVCKNCDGSLFLIEKRKHLLEKVA